MNIRTFIDRPVFSSVISILLVLGGLLALAILPIERYPNIAPPTINVSTTYTGASAETVQKSVIVPLEEAINGVENMTYMYSTATNNGSANIRVYFKQGTDPDMAAVNVQNCVSRATRQLPSEVTDVGVTVRKRQTNILEQIAIYSPNGTYDRTFLVNYIKINLVPAISRISGVGDIDVQGSDYSMRIWLKPDIMAQYKLIPEDITTALAEQNIEAATGAFGENSDQTFQYAMRYKGRLEKPEEFENIVIRALPNGELLRLKDVADVELGTQSYMYIGEVNQCPGTSLSIYQTPGSNATEVINNIDAFMEKARESFPPDVDMVVLSSANDFLYASIHNVVRTLIEAIILVTLVVFVFLRSLRSTMIPLVGIIVSLIGTFMFLYLFGFSINLLTLFALVLSIGVVVDDAIIVVEAVHSKFDAGYRSPYKAAIDAMHGITSAVVTSSLVFMAVFIPVSLIGGTSGVFYTQFGLTMAVAVGISAINALTLSPALCSLILKPKDENGNTVKMGFSKRFNNALDASFEALRSRYLRGVTFFLRHRWVSGLLLVASVVALVFLMRTTKTGLIPQEDMGTVRVDVSTPPGSSLAYTKSVMDRVDNDVIRSISECRAYINMAGYSMTGGAGTSQGSFTLRLKHWDEPKRQGAQCRRYHGPHKGLYGQLQRCEDLHFVAGDDPRLRRHQRFRDVYPGPQGRRHRGPGRRDQRIPCRTQPASGDRFGAHVVQPALPAIPARCRCREVQACRHISKGGAVGAERLLRRSVVDQVQPVHQTLSGDGAGRPALPRGPSDAEQHLRAHRRRDGSVSQFVKLTKIYAPENLSRFNMFPCIGINGRAAQGYSSGDAIRAINEVAAETLPIGYGFDFAGIAREEATSGNNTIYIFIVCITLIYLILCALYESYILPFAVILSVPFGVFGSFLFAKMMGLENNIYLQTGLIMLIGLLAKTAILITEYAVEHRRAGMSIMRAAFSATKERFRPILMTALTMIFGLLPLMFSNGVGANGNNTLGSGVVGGMLIGTLALLFIVPPMFVVFQLLQEKLRRKPEKAE